MQKHVSYIEIPLDTIRDKNYEVQEKMIDNNVEDKIVDEWVNITSEKMERYYELVDRLKGYLEDLRKEKETKIRKKMRCKKRGSKQERK